MAAYQKLTDLYQSIMYMRDDSCKQKDHRWNKPQEVIIFIA